MALRRNFDLALVALVIGGFVFVATQRLATVPVYEIDEAYTLQVPYEMLNRGKLALPMYRYLGGNIENVWHSLTPLFFLILSGFLEVFGFGVPQGRVFNVITVVLTLWMVFLIGRRLFDWRAGLIAVLMITSDQTVLERTRLLRNDYIAEALALLAFYLYDRARERNSGRLYVASGLAAGAGVMCHTAILYMLGAICLLMLLTEGRRVFVSKKLYQFLAGAFAVMSYEIVYDVLDYKNLLLQYRGDDYHFGILSLSGWWSNLLDEPIRYARWYAANDVTFYSVPRTLLHLFQGLTIAAVIYLIVRCVRFVKRGNALNEPRVRLLVVTVAMLLFFANIAHKSGYYNAHLVTWFGLCVGVMLADGLSLVARLRATQSLTGRLIHRAAVAAVAVAVVAYCALLVKQQAAYVKEVRNPDLASFQEMKDVLRSIVPDDLCPVAVKTPVMWLAFPEKDRCFANIDRRMAAAAADIDGKDYALIVRPKSPDYWARDLDQQHPLLGELTNTPYGNFLVYYTGDDARFVTEPKRYHFFRRWAGHVSGEQLAQAREIWSASAADLNESEKIADTSMTADGLMLTSGRDSSGESTFTELCSVDLKPAAAYEMVLDSKSSEGWEAVLIEERTGGWIKQIELRSGKGIGELFRTFAEGRVRILVRALTPDSAGSLFLSRLSFREISEL
jgi:4-amino-4-deoxy-L-arabinose transferase-like glycosyltransferase